MTFDEWMLTKDRSYVPTDDSMPLRLLRECWVSRDAEIAELKAENNRLARAWEAMQQAKARAIKNEKEIFEHRNEYIKPITLASGVTLNTTEGYIHCATGDSLYRATEPKP